MVINITALWQFIDKIYDVRLGNPNTSETKNSLQAKQLVTKVQFLQKCDKRNVIVLLELIDAKKLVQRIVLKSFFKDFIKVSFTHLLFALKISREYDLLSYTAIFQFFTK